ncbi:MAG TPA: hypothetical protein VG297_01815 [Bryobacteraceae bacterium]|nr:hypothetical protein [Bryobacteraceae bacterium]
MIPTPLLRLVVPTQSTFGFSPADYVLLGLAGVIAGVFALRLQILWAVNALAKRPLVSMLVLAALPIALRLAMLGHHPVPVPRVADDFSYLLLGDTLAHFRLANPMHPMRRFFEAVFVLQEPSRSSIYPLGQGLALAFGQLLFRVPWAGVLMSDGLLAALTFWMLRAWTDARWALLGGVLAAIEFGPLSPWVNTYWGGAVSGIAGCLVFGALPRLKQTRRTRDAVLLGIGLGLQLLTRPFEFAILVLLVILSFAPARSLLIAAAVLLPAAGLTLLQNKQVTGAWLTLPYQVSRCQYGVPATFTFEPNPTPHRALTAEQQVDYDSQIAVHGPGTDTMAAWFSRLVTRVRFYRFFFLAPLYLVIPAFALTLREYRFAWVLMAIALFWIAGTFYPYFYPHYIAAAACLFLLVTVKSLEVVSRLRIKQRRVGTDVVALILILCHGHFGFWYGVELAGDERLLNALNAEAYPNVVNYGDPEGRIAVDRQLAHSPGRQLVFVHFSPRHGPEEWIQNRADIDNSKVVWAIDRGSAENTALTGYYPDRTAWLLEGDVHPPILRLYIAR